MEFWIKMNQQFLFTDPNKEQMIIRIVGKDILNELKNMELAQTQIPDEVITQTADLIDQTPGGLAPEEIEVISNVSKVPANPVTDEEGNIVPKLDMSEDGSIARLFVEKGDLQGSFDYIPDVKSMQIGVSEEAINGRNQALYILLSPGVQQQLQMEGATINVKDLLISVLEDNGVKNASKLFQSGQVNGQIPAAVPGQPGQGLPANLPQGFGNFGGSQMPFGPSINEGMANIPQTPGLSA
jgi:hypothetical protein